LAGIVVLSELSSVLIVWLYVGRNIVSRLTHLSAAMAAIAGGRRDIAVNHEGADEIAAMGRSVEVFRQNAIERDTLLAERAEAAEQLERQGRAHRRIARRPRSTARDGGSIAGHQ
jgi:HAMP domain-containing protein